jgi:hypothetical protein
MEEFKRICPKCKKEITHKHYVSYRFSLKKNKPCSRCANKERANRPEERKKNSERQKGKRTGKNNPFYGKTHTAETRRIIKEKRKKQIIPSGENHPLYGKKLEEIVGIEKAVEIKRNKSVIYTGDGNPMYGKPSPQGSGNGWSGWYNGWFFRSILELSYMIKVIDRYSMEWKSGEKSEYRISYIDRNGVSRNYFPDFIINNKYMVEIKPKSLINTPSVFEKAKAGIKYCNEHGMIYKITNVPSLTDKQLCDLIESNQVKLTERYKQKYDESYAN